MYINEIKKADKSTTAYIHSFSISLTTCKVCIHTYAEISLNLPSTLIRIESNYNHIRS